MVHQNNSCIGNVEGSVVQKSGTVINERNKSNFLLFLN